MQPQKLYIDRVAPLWSFDVKDANLVLYVCMELNHPEIINKFWSTWGLKSGIYILGLIDNPSVYYIGKTYNFIIRFMHIFKLSLIVNFTSY